MRWRESWKADPEALALADRHYNRRSVGSRLLGPPGQLLTLVAGRPVSALWVSLCQRPEFTKHDWPGAWLCSTFRNEGGHLSSELITEAVAATLGAWGDPPEQGFITFVDERKVRSNNPGFCYPRAGWRKVGRTKRGLRVLQLRPADFPAPFRIGQQELL